VLAANRVEEGFRLGTVGRPLPRFELQLRTEAGMPAEADEGEDEGEGHQHYDCDLQGKDRGKELPYSVGHIVFGDDRDE